MKPISPMEALLALELPAGGDWQYEPKWDGFRCIAMRSGNSVEMWSKSGKSLARYFPEILGMLGRLRAKQFILDGELLISNGRRVSFEDLQLRLHPAESRIKKLAQASPALFVAFDCLAVDGKSIASASLDVRRSALEVLMAAENEPMLRLSSRTADRETASSWLKRGGGALDGVMAKPRSEPYQPGKKAMFKIKQRRTADCIVGGFRYASRGNDVGSLLLGLYNEAGLLDHVGYTSSFSAQERVDWTKALEQMIGPPGFTGSKPGGPSRWSTSRSVDWKPLRTQLVVEVAYDQVTAGRFRHGTKLLRIRPDKNPADCTSDQLAPALTPAQLRDLIA